MNEQMSEIFENIKSCYSSTEQGAWKDGFLEGYQAAIAAQAQQPSGKPIQTLSDLLPQGFTWGDYLTPDAVLHIALAANLKQSQGQQSRAARLLLLKREIERICDDVKYAKDAKLAIQKLDFSRAASLPPAPVSVSEQPEGDKE